MPRPLPGRSGWKAMAARRSPRPPSASASTADCAGWKWSATAARPARGLPLEAIRRPRDTPLWKLEASLKCRNCRKGRYAPPVHMIKLTETREITPYKWVHPSEER